MFRRKSACLLIAIVYQLSTPDNPAATLKKFEDVLGVQGFTAIQVGGLEPGMAAERAGLQTSDVIVAFNAQGLRAYSNYRSFLEAMRRASFQGGAILDIWRFDPASERYIARQIELRLETEPADAHQLYLGIRAGPTYLVTGVVSGGPAERLGVTAGDFIGEVNGHDFAGAVELDRIASEIADSSNRQVSLWVTRWIPMENGKLRGKNPRRLTGTL